MIDELAVGGFGGGGIKGIGFRCTVAGDGGAVAEAIEGVIDDLRGSD